MKKWTVRSTGRFERILISYFILLGIILSLFFSHARKSIAEMSSWNSHETLFHLVMVSPIMLPLLIVPLKRLMTAKIPKEIAFDRHGNIVITYGRRTQDAIAL